MPKSKKLLIAGWICFILGYFFLMGLLSGLPDAGPVFSIWLIGLFPLGLILLFIGFRKILNKIIILCVFILLVGMFFSAIPNHGKARDASIKATIASMRAQAERGVTGDGDKWHYPDNLCDQDNGPMSALFKALVSIKARDVRCFISSDLKSWAVSVRLRDSDDLYCSDSDGFSDKVLEPITSPSCELVKVQTNQ